MILQKMPGERGGSLRSGFAASLSARMGVVYCAYFMIYSVTSPYLQLILRRLGYGPAAIGLLLGFYELVGIAGPIVLARAADAAGKFKPFLYGTHLAMLAAAAILATIRSPIAIIVSLSFLALGLKTPGPVLDSSALIAIEAERAAGRKVIDYGALRAIGSAGYVLIVLILQAIPGYDGNPPFVMAMAMAAFMLLSMASITIFPEMGSGRARSGKRPINLSWVDAPFVIGLVTIALGRLAMAPTGSFFSLYLVEELDWYAVGGMYALAAIAEIPMMLVAWRFMRKRSPMAAIAISSAAIVVRLLIYALVPTKGGVVTAQLLHSLCYGLFQPASVAFVNMKTPPAERTTGMALLLGIGIGLPAFIGSAIGGFIVEAVGYRWLFASFCVFAAASLALYAANRKALDAVR